MHIKTFLLAPLCALLLLPAQPSAAEDRAKEITQPPQSVEGLQDWAGRDWERSVESPVAWITVEDHLLTLYDESGKEVYHAVYPSLHLTDDSTSSLAKALEEWNAEIGTAAWHSEVRSLSEEARASGYDLPLTYTDITPLSRWGRVDDQMVSFFMEGWLYAGGAHPISHVQAYTFDRASGRQIALDEIVTSRENLLAAIAAEFPRQFPAAVEEDFPEGVMEALRVQHPPEKGLSGFHWFILADGNICIHYPRAVLASYAAGDFTLRIRRTDAPEVFTDAYPME